MPGRRLGCQPTVSLLLRRPPQGSGDSMPLLLGDAYTNGGMQRERNRTSHLSGLSYRVGAGAGGAVRHIY